MNPAPEGGYTCHFEELPEVFSEGDTLDDAKANLLDALAQVMEYDREEPGMNFRFRIDGLRLKKSSENREDG